MSKNSVRKTENGINWVWCMTDTKEDAIAWYTELTGYKPYSDEICEMLVPKDGCKWSFRVHK